MDDGYIPINWIHLSSDRKKIIVNSSDDEAPSPVGLLLFTVEPLGGGTLNGLGNYDCNTMASPAQLEENVTGFFPGPLTLALPVNDLEWEGQISEVAQKGMNAIQHVHLFFLLVLKSMRLVNLVSIKQHMLTTYQRKKLQLAQ